MNSTLSLIAVILAFGFGSAKITVNEKQIELHLSMYFDNVEKSTGIPIPATKRKSIVSKYTDGKTLIKGKDVTLKRVAEVLISVEKNWATLGNEQPCELENQEIMDSLYAGGLHDRSFKETFAHFVKLDKSEKKFCNFFAYLRCQHDPKNKAQPHRCLCPHHPDRMTWQDHKCVFKIGHKCDDISALSLQDKAFPVFDYADQEFSRDILSHCEGKSRCRHGESNMCEIDGDFGFLASPSEISAFLRSEIEKNAWGYEDFSEGGKHLEILRFALKGITHNSKVALRRALSLEMRSSAQRTRFGQGCDPEQDARFEALLKNYNPRESPDAWNANKKDIGLDTVRYHYQ